MKLSTFVALLSWSTFFGVCWICALQNDFNAGRIGVLVISFVVGIVALVAGSAAAQQRGKL